MAAIRRGHLVFVPAFVAALGMAQLHALAQKTADLDTSSDDEPSAEELEQSQERFEYMVRALQKYHVEIDGDDSQPAKLDSDASLRWSNPLGDVMDGLLTVYTTSETARPVVIAHFHVHGPKHNWLEMHEFAAVHPGEIQLMRGRREIWNPDERYGSFESLDDAPIPSENKSRRLTQMKRMAERFTIIDHFRRPNSEPEPAQLRMISRPIYRYGADDGKIIDAALFTFVLTTDPEASLLVEIHRNGDSHEWKYALFPMTIYKLETELDGELVWTKPEALVFGNPTAPHYPASYRGDLGEGRLRSMFPDPDR